MRHGICNSCKYANPVWPPFKCVYIRPLLCNVDSSSVDMARRRISEDQRWQIIGMHSAGMSHKAIGRQLGYHYSVISRLVRKHDESNAVKDRPRSGRPRATSQRGPGTDPTGTTSAVCVQPIIEAPVATQPTSIHTNGQKPLESCRVEGEEGHQTSPIGRSPSAHTFGMVFSKKRLEFEYLEKNPLVGRKSVHATCGGWTNEGLEAQEHCVYTQEHPPNCSLWRGFCNGLGVYLPRLQTGFTHYPRKPHRCSVHSRGPATSRRASF